MQCESLSKIKEPNMVGELFCEFNKNSLKNVFGAFHIHLAY